MKGYSVSLYSWRFRRTRVLSSWYFFSSVRSDQWVWLSALHCWSLLQRSRSQESDWTLQPRPVQTLSHTLLVLKTLWQLLAVSLWSFMENLKKALICQVWPFLFSHCRSFSCCLLSHDALRVNSVTSLRIWRVDSLICATQHCICLYHQTFSREIH